MLSSSSCSCLASSLHVCLVQSNNQRLVGKKWFDVFKQLQLFIDAATTLLRDIHHIQEQLVDEQEQ